MPVGSDLEARCQQTLEEIVIISQRIRRSVLAYAKRQGNNRRSNAASRLSSQLEAIRISADKILEVIDVDSLSVDQRIVHWVFSGELYSCLRKLQEMADMLKTNHPIGFARAPAPLLRESEDKFTEVMAFFDQHSNLFHLLLAPNIWDMDTLLQQSPEALRIIEVKKELQQKINEVCRWLDAWDCALKHHETRKLRQEGTCKWFLDTHAYKDWRVLRNQFLWLQGKAGCGKSVLISSVIEHVKRDLREGEVMIFFYCDFRNRRSTSSTELMRSLLSQLFHLLPDYGLDFEDLPNKILQEKSKGTFSLHDRRKLEQFLSLTVGCFRWEPIIIVDALDECEDMKPLIDVLVSLTRVRILVTSRPHPIIKNHHTRLPSLSFDDVVDELASDITLHINLEIYSDSRLGSTDAHVQAELCTELNGKANGRFRWVQCQLDILKRYATMGKLRDALNRLPDELDLTYERILGEIDERMSDLAQRTLAWLVVSQVPLRLSQIVEGLSLDPRRRMIICGTPQPEYGLVDSLLSLVSYSEETDFLSLSHFSVKEYLTNITPLTKYRIILPEAHAEVLRMCTCYISVLLRKSFSRDVAQLGSSSLLSYVLSTGFDHITHVESGPGSTVTFEALEYLASGVQHYPSHWDRLCELREETLGSSFPPWPSSRHDIVLYILVAYCTPRLLESYLSRHHSLKWRVGTSPLVYAADLRKSEHAMKLLAHNNDVNQHGLVFDDSHMASPLEVAIDFGEDALVGELLKRGSIVTSEMLSIAICMPWCSTRVLVKLMQTDEFVEWANEIGDEKLYRGVFNSARPSVGGRGEVDKAHVVLARRLHGVGQELSQNTLFGQELTERALHAAHTSLLEFLLPRDQPPPARLLISAATGDTPETLPVIQFLLRKGIDIHAVSDGGGDTALHLAVMCPWEPRRLELTQMLLDAGCHPLALNSSGETPWSITVDRGYLSAMELILAGDAQSSYNLLPYELQRRQTPRMILDFIGKGIDVHSTTSDGDTVIHLAVAKYSRTVSLELVRMFIEAGCNPTAPNFKGETALGVAVERGFTSVVEFILRNLHDVSPPDALSFALQESCSLSVIQSLICNDATSSTYYTTSTWGTMLYLAITKCSESKYLELIKIFIEVGYDPNACDAQGTTILQAAIKRDFTSVVEFLLSNNVSPPSDALPFALQESCNPSMIQALTHNCANTYFTTSTWGTMLYLAITKYSESTYLELIKLLIKVGYNPNACNAQGTAILQAAIEHDFTSVVEFLLSRNVSTPSDVLPFALQQSCSPAIIHALIHNAADVYSLTSSTGGTMLHLAVTKYYELTCLELIKMFVEVGCDPNACNANGQTILQVAIKRNFTSVVDFLFSINISPDFLPLVFALKQRCSCPMVQTLIHNGADVYSTTPTGDTTLHLAIMKYSESTCLELIKVLIEAGCDPNACNAKGITVLQAAIKRGFTSVVELLFSNVSPPPDILPFALEQCCNSEMIQVLILNGADVHAVTPNWDTVLHLAIVKYPESTCLELFQIFVDAGCSLANRTENSEGKTALKIAMEREYQLVQQMMLRAPCT